MRSLKFIRHPYVALVLRLALGGVFLYAGIQKAADPQAFGLEIANYRMVPHGLLNLMAIILPWLEIVTAVGLIAGAWTRSCAAITGVMLVVFIIAIVSALRRGLDISCGCFGGGAEAAKLGQSQLWRDVLWLLWAAHVFLYDRGVLGIDGLLARRRAATSEGASS